jgi:transcriptional regulator with XRE-family HTH domain
MIGDKIREIRKHKGLTLNELAISTGFTASYISQLERNVIDPSISALRKIASALEVPIYRFIDDDDNKQSVLIKADKRQKLWLPDSSIIYEFLTPMASTASSCPNLEIIYFRLNAESWSREEYSYHKAEECIFVIKGSLIVDLEAEKYELEEGDSVYIKENVPHKIYNPRKTETRGILCITPPIY